MRVTSSRFRVSQEQIGTLPEEHLRLGSEVGELDANTGVVVARPNRRRRAGRLVTIPEQWGHATSIGSHTPQVD